MTALPLEGITVVSLEQAVAAPYATRQLADLGARVIKVERPGSGDFARGYDESVLGQSSYFVWLNRSKSSIALDLKDDRAIAVLHDLLATADVFVANLAPGAADRLGLSTSSLQERYPRLVVCTISGYGTTGPWAGRKAYDLLVQCEAGLVAVTGDGEMVTKAGISIADIAAGSNAYAGVLAALFARERTGTAPAVEVSLFEALTEWMGAPDYYTIYSGEQPPRIGVEHPTISPYGLFRTGDGDAIVIAVQNEREWAELCDHLLGDRTLSTDPRFAKNASRVANRAELRALIEAALAPLDLPRVVVILERAGIAYANVNAITEAVAHPVLSGRDRWRDVETPSGTIRALIPPVDISGTEAPMGPVPALGEHTEAILTSLGWTESGIAALVDAGVIGTDR